MTRVEKLWSVKSKQKEHYYLADIIRADAFTAVICATINFQAEIRLAGMF